MRSETIDLAALVGAELAPLRERYPRTRFELVGDHPVEVRTDPSLIRQILANLLDNAGKYGGEDAAVMVRLAKTLSGAVIEVHDTGPGIPTELHPRLFEPGFRTDEAVKSEIHGDGLGLYVSSELAQRLGGALSVVSEPGDGASVFLQLPTRPPDGPTEARE